MGLTVCYFFRLFYFVLCDDFSFVPSYSMVVTSYNMMLGRFIDYIHLGWCFSYVVSLSYSFFVVFTL